MTCASAAKAAAPVPACPRAHGRLSPRFSFHLLASITLAFLAGSAAPTPLYAIYQQQWGFSATMLTVAFGSYALAVLVSLLVAGRLSDYIGRRPVLMAAAAVQAAAMVVFATADGLSDLLAGRVIQGLSAGAAIAAVGAGMLDIDKARGALANALAPMLGTAVGGIMAGIMVQYLPAPTHLVYAVLGVVFVLQGIGIFFIAETAPRRRGALASLVPSFAMPASVRTPLLLALPIVVAVWGLGGFYASLGPTLLRSLVGSSSVLLGGLALFLLAVSGVIAVAVLRDRSARMLARFGAVALMVGMAAVLAALSLHSLALFMVGTAIAGTGFGTGFQGALRNVIAPLPPTDRAGVLSVLFVVSYLAMGVPAILAGYDVAQRGDIVFTAREFGAGVLLLGALAWLGAARAAPSTRIQAASPRSEL